MPCRDSKTPLGVGTYQPVFIEGSTYEYIEIRSRHAISEQCPLRGVYTPPTDSSENLEDLWQDRCCYIRFKRKLSLPFLSTSKTIHL